MELLGRSLSATEAQAVEARARHRTGIVIPAAHDGQATPGQISCFWRRAPGTAWTPTGPPLLRPTEAGVRAAMSAPMPVCWPAECRGGVGGFGLRRVGAEAPPWRRRAAVLASVAWARLGPCWRWRAASLARDLAAGSSPIWPPRLNDVDVPDDR